MVYKNRPTIGLLMPDLVGWYYQKLLFGIVAGCGEYRVNLRTFVGDYLKHSKDKESGKKLLFDLANKNNIDGIISPTGSLCINMDEGEINAYFKNFSPLPIVSISGSIKGFPVITSDNATGMYQVVDHLVTVHGYRKMAFLAGHEGDEDSEIRLNAFKQVLHDNNIPFDNSCIFYGDFSRPCAKEGLHTLLDVRNLEIEAIVCGNDNMALDVCKELQKRKIRVPQDIAVTGFDNRPSGEVSFPPLTTVGQQIGEQGKTAVKILFEMIQNRRVPENAILPATLIIRPSCGCLELSYGNEKLPGVNPLPGKRETLPVNGQSRLIDLIKTGYCSSPEMRTKAALLINAFISDMEEKKENPPFPSFINTYREIVYHSKITEEELAAWDTIVKLLLDYYSSTATDVIIKKDIEIAKLQAGKLKAEIKTLILERAKPADNNFLWDYNFFLNPLEKCRHFDELLNEIIINFPRSEMSCFYLVLYEGARYGLGKDAVPTEKARLHIGYEDGKINKYDEGILFNTANLLPGGRFDYYNENLFIMYPLHASEKHYGYILFEYEQKNLRIFHSTYTCLCTAFDTITYVSGMERYRNQVDKTNRELDNLNKNLERKVKERTMDLEKANEKLKELDTAKTNFFANISHELRTPLTLILSPLESLLAGDFGKPVLSDPAVYSVFTAMHINSIRLLGLINTLLDFSKIEAGRMELKKQKTDLVKLLHFYVNSIHSGVRSKGLKIEFICRTEKILMNLDRDMIEKSFFNLISNAIKFSSREGKITVELRQEKNTILLSVADQGIGIPPDKLDAVFERFTQVEGNRSRKYEGTGIGLAFTREIIELHKGTITAESTLGEGSVFTIRLPLPDADSQEIKEGEDVEDVEEAGFNEIQNRVTVEFTGEKDSGPHGQAVSKKTAGPENPEQAPGKEAYILVVDDNSTMRDFIKGLLEKKYTTKTAVNGKHALEVIEKGIPDLIVSDVMMPEIDGLELCRILKENMETSQIPIILLTARMDITARIEGLESRADDYLFKPFNARELFARIRNLLEKHRLEQDLQTANEALWSEMETARQIQSSLLPTKAAIPGFEMACYLQSASLVSGDYYDVIHTGERSWLVIGDVSGHGVTAGLVMMMVQTAINVLLAKHPDISPAQLLSDINRTIKNNIGKLNQEKYMTINVFVLIEKNRFLFSGLHQDIFVYRADSNTVDILETRGMWVGLMDDISGLVKNDAIDMKKGDTLLVYTDGITEANRKNWSPGERDKRFGEAKLVKILKAHGHKKPDEIKAVLQHELEGYICDDDFTFVILQSNSD